jgi:hypothetical protein
MGAAGCAALRRSRFQVLTDGEMAWAEDSSGALYRFDGLYFSRRRLRDTSYRLVPSWMTPPHGWLLLSDCPCAEWILLPESPTAVGRRPNLSFGGLRRLADGV